MLIEGKQARIRLPLLRRSTKVALFMATPFFVLEAMNLSVGDNSHLFALFGLVAFYVCMGAGWVLRSEQ